MTMTRFFIARAAIALLAGVFLAQSVHAAEPNIIWRSGSTGTIPAASAPATPPANPTNPLPADPAPPLPVAFTSAGFSSARETRTATVNGNQEYGLPWGFNVCVVVDSQSKTRDSLMKTSFYPGSEVSGNTAAIMIVPSVSGVYNVVISCGQSANSLSPTDSLRIEVK